MGRALGSNSKILGPLVDRRIEHIAQAVDRIPVRQIGIKPQMPPIDPANAHLSGTALVDLAHAGLRFDRKIGRTRRKAEK